jgi:cytochrome P450
MIGGRGLLWADGDYFPAFLPSLVGTSHIALLLRANNITTGDVHKRHRRAMQPGFGAPEARALFPVILASARKVRGFISEFLIGVFLIDNS